MTEADIQWMPASHEPSAWLRGTVQRLRAAFDAGQLTPCCHAGMDHVLLRVWAPSEAACSSCAGNVCASRDTCDRCGRIGHAAVGRHIYRHRTTGHGITVAFALCGGCWGSEYDWQAELSAP